MKIDKSSLILGLVIGIVIGAIAMGILDAKRPKPLFSSANNGMPCEAERLQYVFDFQQWDNGNGVSRGFTQDRWSASDDAFKSCINNYVANLAN